MTQRIKYPHVQQYGDAVYLNNWNTDTSSTRLIHPEEARSILVRITAGTPNLVLRLPYDVRVFRQVGLMFHIFNHPNSTKFVEIRDVASALVANSTLANGQCAMIHLESNATAAGTWRIYRSVMGAKARAT